MRHVAPQAGLLSNRRLEALWSEGASHNASEPTAEASKREDESGQPSEGGEARTTGEAIGTCSRSTLRGRVGWRGPTEQGGT